jgi:hypothetical protein
VSTNECHRSGEINAALGISMARDNALSLFGGVVMKRIKEIIADVLEILVDILDIIWWINN